MADSKALLMNGNSVATTGRTSSSSSSSESKKRRKNKKDGIFLKQRRQHLRRGRFARNARRARRRKHREARYRRNHPWPYWNKYTTKRGSTENDVEHAQNSDQQYLYQRYLKSAQDGARGWEGLVYRQGENETARLFSPTVSVWLLCFLISIGITALEAYEIGLGIVQGILALTLCAMSLAIAGVSLLAKLPWMVLKCILYQVNDYILTPPAMEQRRKTKLEFYVYMFCLPFLPCWASVGCPSAPNKNHPRQGVFKCSGCNAKQRWDAIPEPPEEDDSHDFCILKCPDDKCQEDLVQCRHCNYNFQLNDQDALGRHRMSNEARTKKKMKQHMQNKHKTEDDYIPTLLSDHGQSNDLIAQASSMFCDAASSLCDAFGCGGSSYHDEDEVDVSQNFFSTLQDDLADLHLESEATKEREETLPDDSLDVLAFLMESTIMEKEEEEAETYFSQFRGTDLDPNTLGSEEQAKEADPEVSEMGTDHTHLYHDVGEVGRYKYSDFAFFDRRSADEKEFRKGSFRNRLCQNQIYFYEKYLLQQLNEKDGTGGFAGLVHRANTRNREDSSNPYYGRYVEWLNKVSLAEQTGTTPQGTNPTAELKQMHRMLNLLINLSDTQKQDLLEFHKENMKLFNADNISNDLKIHYPTNMPDARAVVLDGAHSIMKNFPVPQVFEISGHEHGTLRTPFSHACVSLEEVIQLAAGHGVKFNFGYDARKEKGQKINTEGLNGTQAMWDLKEDVILAMNEAGRTKEEINQTNIGYIYFWSDSFLRCFIKQRENSVWVLTVTICPPESVKSNGTNTFVLAMGKSGKDVDHTPVIEHYIEECQRLMKGFDCYFGDTNEIGRMAVGLLFSSADRPERQSISETRQEGIYGKVTGWAVNVSEEKFPACRRCHRRRVLEMIGGTEDDEEEEDAGCQCLDWTLDPDPSCDEQKTDRPGKDYPKESDDESFMGDAPEGRLPGQDRLGPIKLTSEWMRKALKTAYNGMRHHRWTKGSTEAYLQSCNVSGATVDRVTTLAKDDLNNKTQSEPSEYEPKFWALMDCFSRFRLPDLPMHGLAHGIIGDVMDIIHTILKNYSKGAHFFVWANKTTMEDVASFGLDWCKVKTLPQSAWVNENKMAYMRLMSYLYGMYFSNCKLTPGETTEKTKETVSSLKRMINALQALMSVLMSRAEPDERTTDNHMKLFMSSADSLHKGYGSLANKPKGKKDRLVDKLSVQDLRRIMIAFCIDERTFENDTTAALKNRVNGMNKGVLNAKCREFQLDTKGLKLKEDFQKRVFEHILEKSIVEETQTQGQTGTAGDNQEEGETEAQDQTGSEVINEDQEEGEKGGDTRPNDKRMCWNKGNWLSFLVNIAAQMKYLGPLAWIWEAKDERQIDGPKGVLVSMRKDQQYKETKMRLLHKLKGLDLVADSFYELEGRSAEERHWFKGYHVFSSRKEVIERIEQGKPLSCFCLSHNVAEVHVAFTEDENRGSTISYLTLTYDTNCNKVETGVHFCRFGLKTEGSGSHRPLVVSNIEKSHLRPQIVDYALMLPYIVDTSASSTEEDVFNQYTLIYPDWEVLRCDGNGQKKKDRVAIDKQLFLSSLM